MTCLLSLVTISPRPPPRALALALQEFHPYVFQVFAQLIELRPAPLPQLYLQIFPPLLSPVFWERSGNVPALVRLLQVRPRVLPTGPAASGSPAPGGSVMDA